MITSLILQLSCKQRHSLHQRVATIERRAISPHPKFARSNSYFVRDSSPHGMRARSDAFENSTREEFE